MKKLLTTTLLAMGLLTTVATEPVQAQANPTLGMVYWVGFGFCPRGFAEAEGQLLPIAQNTALFSLYGTIYGGDGRTTFALPDLMGRSAVSAGNGPGLTNYRMGEKRGVETGGLSANTMPSHNHTAAVVASADGADSGTVAGATLAGANIYSAFGADDATLGAGSVSMGTVGGSQSFSVRSPYLVMRACVALQGVYPSRS